MAQIFLDAGEYVIATTGNPETLSFRAITAGDYLRLALDATLPSDIEAAFSSAFEKFKRIDAVINNAAYCLIGPLETFTDTQIRPLFDTNFLSRRYDHAQSRESHA